MLALEANEAAQSEEKRLFTTLIDLLSYEKIIFNGKYYYYYCLFYYHFYYQRFCFALTYIYVSF